MRVNLVIKSHYSSINITKVMNKTELIEKIAEGSGLSKVDSKKALDAAVAAIKEPIIPIGKSL